MSKPHQKFVTVINCIDGRVQEPVRQYMKKKFETDFSDTITYPGVDNILANDFHEIEEQLKKEVRISINAHGSHVIAVCGHHFCAANPVSKSEHRNHIKSAVSKIKSWNLPVEEVTGLFVNSKWEVEKVV